MGPFLIAIEYLDDLQCFAKYLYLLNLFIFIKLQNLQLFFVKDQYLAAYNCKVE